MDLETENRIAAILLKEAAELRRQAEREGVHIYLQKPNVRVRPNSRFLSATVHGVQQANRAVEVNEMWRARHKELELEDRLDAKTKDNYSSGTRCSRVGESSRERSTGATACDRSSSDLCSSRKRVFGSCRPTEDGGLRDEELEEFLHSKVKRGRGSVGPRMDEAGPYLAPSSDDKRLSMSPDVRVRERKILGPDRPSSLKNEVSSEEESDGGGNKKPRKDGSSRSKKHHSRRHRSKEKSKEKKNKKKVKRRDCK